MGYGSEVADPFEVLWISTRNPCPVPSEISSDVDVLVNVPTHLAIPNFRAQIIPSWQPIDPEEKHMFSQCCRPLWHHARHRCGLRMSKELVSRLIWPCWPTTQPWPSNSLSQNHVASSRNMPVKQTVKVGKKNSGAEVRGGESAPAAIETLRRSSCSSNDTSEVNCVALSSFILTPHASRLSEGANCSSRFFFLSVPSFFHCTCTHTLSFCYQP